MSNGVSNLVSAPGLSGFRCQCSNTLDFLLPTDFCQRLPRTPHAWPPGRRTRDLDANRGHRRTAGSLDAALFLAGRVKAAAEQRVYDMVDVLRAGGI